MALANLIDLIAEVAAKRVAKEGKPKEDTPDAVSLFCAAILAEEWRPRHIFICLRVFTSDWTGPDHGRTVDRPPLPQESQAP